MPRPNRSSFLAADGTALDILVHAPENPRGCFLIYPCIGGTTRAYTVPYDVLCAAGYAVIEYHPRSHGRSQGQMSMEAALHDLYHFLGVSRFLDLPLVILAHSAGANAVLQLNKSFLNITAMHLVQPVLDFRESMEFMYRYGTQEEFITAISKWVIDPNALRQFVANANWLDGSTWHNDSYRSRLDAISTPAFNLGHFLENFYIPGFNTYDALEARSSIIQIYLSRKDTWYPIETTERLARQNSIPIHFIEPAHDHYFTGNWNYVWDLVLAQVTIVDQGATLSTP